MNYEKLGIFVESLMVSLVKGEIDEKELVQAIQEHVEELRNDNE